MIKAFFLDFYGTVVHEDGEIIKKITQIIYETGKAENTSEIDTFWWNDFQNMFTDSYGRKFETQSKPKIPPTPVMSAEAATYPKLFKIYKERRTIKQNWQQGTLKGKDQGEDSSLVFVKYNNLWMVNIPKYDMIDS